MKNLSFLNRSWLDRNTRWTWLRLRQSIKAASGQLVPRGALIRTHPSRAFPRVSLGLMGWATSAITSAILLCASPALAYTTEDLLTVSRVEGESYRSLVRRAETTARNSAQQQFDSDILLTRVIVTVLGQNGGQTAPILVMNVNRNDWRSRPDPQYWSKYYRSTPILLELDGTVPVQASPAAPVSIPTPLPAPAPIPGTPGSPEATPTPIPGAPGSAEATPAGAVPPVINIPATPAGQIGLPRSVLQ